MHFPVSSKVLLPSSHNRRDSLPTTNQMDSVTQTGCQPTVFKGEARLVTQVQVGACSMPDAEAISPTCYDCNIWPLCIITTWKWGEKISQCPSYYRASTNNTGKTCLFIHLVCNEDMKAHRNGAKLPAWLVRQVPGQPSFYWDISCPVAEKKSLWSWGLHITLQYKSWLLVVSPKLYDM